MDLFGFLRKHEKTSEEIYHEGQHHAHNLGSIYMDRKNLKEAYSCYRIGANKGYKPSAEMCDKILAFVHKQNVSV